MAFRDMGVRTTIRTRRDEYPYSHAAASSVGTSRLYFEWARLLAGRTDRFELDESRFATNFDSRRSPSTSLDGRGVVCGARVFLVEGSARISPRAAVGSRKTRAHPRLPTSPAPHRQLVSRLARRCSTGLAPAADRRYVGRTTRLASLHYRGNVTRWRLLLRN